MYNALVLRFFITKLYTHDSKNSQNLKLSTSIEHGSQSKNRFQSITFQSSNKNFSKDIERTRTSTESLSRHVCADKVCLLNVMRRHTILCVTHAVTLISLLAAPRIIVSDETVFWSQLTISLMETHVIFLMFPCGKAVYRIVCFVPHQILTRCTSSKSDENTIMTHQDTNDTHTSSSNFTTALESSIAVVRPEMKIPNM